MKKTLLLLTLIAAAFASQAQLTLTGTSYTQNFDAQNASFPTGWFLYTTATSTSLGIADLTYSNGTDWGSYYDTTDCASDVFGTGFKNCASADNGPLASMLTCVLQQGKTNRSLGVRQSSSSSHPGFDPGASFVLKLANTIGDSAFSISFNLQSLDSICPRTTFWTVDYGIGATPTVFTPITTTPSSLPTGNNIFSNQMVTATLPAAVNQQSGPVCIRISTLASTTGSGNRTTSAIDDFSMTWHAASVSHVGVSTVAAQPATSLTVIGQPSSDKVVLSYSVDEEGAYTLSIYDLTGRIIHTETVNAQTGNQALTVNGLHLMPGMYIAKMNNSNSSSVARIAVQ